jgi:hypothetical protein
MDLTSRCAFRCLLLLATSFVFGFPGQSSRDKIIFRNGEVLNCSLRTETLVFGTNYGELPFPVRFIKKIEHLAETDKLESTNNEFITGHLMNESLAVDLGGGTLLDIRKERIDKIIVASSAPPRKAYETYFQMQNGDTFYGRINNSSFDLTTNYGTVGIPFSTILRIEEMDGQTRVHLSNGNIMQGFIATNFLLVTMNYGFDVKIPKNSIKVVTVIR